MQSLILKRIRWLMTDDIATENPIDSWMKPRSCWRRSLISHSKEVQGQSYYGYNGHDSIDKIGSKHANKKLVKDER